MRADTTAGEVICRECGVVLGERLIDDGAEWRTFNNDDTLYGNRSDPNRCGEFHFIAPALHGYYHCCTVLSEC